ncbi:methylated-DNA-[protein]-cysteine S-methyltransferase [Scopulibacillus darangshiensis]|uniref:Methylated-DNA--protein-cysteine methyltransferase n=1 Tax=Scopulibacillus darangshiensis TaxID=442528 RepID=A0A4R2NJM3_9BACL|nr:methylated-DNA--[protein]-cysteine S-methyltransferase [Scopulibacillus darangshiensis]TCP21324.1 methylated-DNA-[protein]-cysteine S-methyltransferase [Scopulibacillus darangshiensis]
MAKRNNHTVYWSGYTNMVGEFHLAATATGLCFVGSPNKGIQELGDWARQRFPEVELIENAETLKPYKQELDEYFQGKQQTFNLPADVEGTTFQQEIWEALKDIPYGETYTYSQIAAMIGRPRAVRAVGTAIGRNPLLISVPCHRVVGKNGSLAGYRGGLEMKEQLLELEQAKKTNTQKSKPPVRTGGLFCG